MKTKTLFNAMRVAIALLAMVTIGTGQVWAIFSSPYTCTFAADLSETDNQVTTGDVTWTISTRTVGKGSPTTTFGNQNGQSAIKLGAGSSNYYSAVTLTTTTFTEFNVTAVELYISSNNGGSKTITVTQGATQIGTKSQSFSSSTWVTNSNFNTSAGSGGTLSISITNDATAIFIHSIKVTFSGGPKRTVTFNAGSGSCGTSSITEASPLAGVTLPSATPNSDCVTEGWVFAGWKTTSAQAATTSIPTLCASGSTYYPMKDETLYAVYRIGDMYTIDFESTASTYSGWTFTHITSGQTDANVTAHDGSKIGLTGNTTNLQTIVSKSAIEEPKTLEFYITKTTTNNTESYWKIYTCPYGSSTWTQRGEGVRADNMGQGKWVKVSQDLSSYSNVYVKIEYGTSGAIRAIDDLTLSCATFNSNPDCTYDYFVDNMHGNETTTQQGTYSMPAALSDVTPGDTYCAEKHYHFIGWLAEDYVNADGTLKSGYASYLYAPGHSGHTANNTTYYAIWAE